LSDKLLLTLTCLVSQTTAHQIYQATAVIEQNDGQPNISAALPTRHEPPESVLGNFHATAGFMAEVIDRHVENSVSGAIIHAQSQIEQGLAADDLDMAYIEEVACANAAREMVETYHGDSRFFPDIQAIARQSGPPSTHQSTH
jgi:hypothetical protein